MNYLPFPYYPLSAHFGEIFSGQSIFSRRAFIEKKRIVLDRVDSSPFYREAFYLDRLAQVSKTTLDGKIVIVINVHFEAFNKATRTKHIKYIIDLYSQYKDDYPVLLAGDFNSDANDKNEAIQLIMNLPGIRSAVNLEENTYPSVSPIKRLDYIFYNEKYIVLKNSKILTSFGDASDHLPVFMEFNLK